ncbi:MAG TPA: hypothetical protein VFS21_20050 [Roseiflexaceae bacterium]|nr:hypothetical protein [Roseiflexaceae bacterium]
MQKEGWPPLTAAELLVLRDPNKAQGAAALKVTLMELLGQRALELRRDPGGKAKDDRLVPAPRAPGQSALRPPQVAALETVAMASSDGQGATIAQTVARARQSYGADMARFQDTYVIPPLLARGLVETRQEKRLWIFTVTRTHRTPAGEQALAELETLLTRAREIPGMLERDSGQALALALSLGGAVLLLDELRPHYAALSEEMRRTVAAGGAGGDSFLWVSSATDIGGASDAFDGVSSLDSGWGAGGGDSGGWGGDAGSGGGDGGGGGGDGGGGGGSGT